MDIVQNGNVETFGFGFGCDCGCLTGVGCVTGAGCVTTNPGCS